MGCLTALLWPLRTLWRLFRRLLLITGRLAGSCLGLTLMIVGAVLTVTVIGAVIGIPLALFGLLLVARSLF